MDLKKKYGSVAMVAGASEGIGAAFSTLLAQSGMDLILIARKKEQLEEFGSVLAGKFQVKVLTLSCDLSDPGAAKYIHSSLGDRSVDMLVYNAALSFIGPFENETPEHCNDTATANMLTPLNLVKILGNKMVERKRGAIVLMSSLAGFQGSGYLATYAATKAFNKILAESLWYEWKSKGVDVIACCAGATSTKNYLATKPMDAGIFAPRVTTPGEVAAECFRQLGNKPSFIAGRGNRIAGFFMHRIMPRKTAITIMGDTTRKIYGL